MNAVTVRIEHNCVTCGKLITVGSIALREYYDAITHAGRIYYCSKCGQITLNLLKKELPKTRKGDK